MAPQSTENKRRKSKRPARYDETETKDSEGEVKGKLKKTEPESDGIKEMFQDILKELKELKSTNENVRRETREELKLLREDMEKRDKHRENEHTSLEGRVNNIENKTQEKISALEDQIKLLTDQEEYRMRKDRKNNIVVKDKDLKAGGENRNETTAKTVEILQKVDASTEITEVTYIGMDKDQRGIVRVTCRSFEDKMKILKNKASLRGQDTYIDSDLTKKERDIQSRLRQLAKVEREKGNNEVRVGYQKILLGGQWTQWKDLNKNDESTKN